MYVVHQEIWEWNLQIEMVKPLFFMLINNCSQSLKLADEIWQTHDEIPPTVPFTGKSDALNSP